MITTSVGLPLVGIKLSLQQRFCTPVRKMADRVRNSVFFSLSLGMYNSNEIEGSLLMVVNPPQTVVHKSVTQLHCVINSSFLSTIQSADKYFFSVTISVSLSLFLTQCTCNANECHCPWNGVQNSVYTVHSSNSEDVYVPGKRWRWRRNCWRSRICLIGYLFEGSQNVQNSTQRVCK